MTEQTIFYMVADVIDPEAEPYMVVRADITAKTVTGGIEGEVMSLHWTKAEADARAAELSRC